MVRPSCVCALICRRPLAMQRKFVTREQAVSRCTTNLDVLSFPKSHCSWDAGKTEVLAAISLKRQSLNRDDWLDVLKQQSISLGNPADIVKAKWQAIYESISLNGLFFQQSQFVLNFWSVGRHKWNGFLTNQGPHTMASLRVHAALSFQSVMQMIALCFRG